MVVFWEGTNDLVVNKATPEVAFEAIKKFCQGRRKAGWQKVVVLTVLPRAAGPVFETERLALNQLLRTRYTEFADGVVDIASDPTIGQAGENESKELYSDGVHTTPKANGIIADMVAPKLTAVLAGMPAALPAGR